METTQRETTDVIIMISQPKLGLQDTRVKSFQPTGPGKAVSSKRKWDREQWESFISLLHLPKNLLHIFFLLQPGKDLTAIFFQAFSFSVTCVTILPAHHSPDNKNVHGQPNGLIHNTLIQGSAALNTQRAKRIYLRSIKRSIFVRNVSFLRSIHGYLTGGSKDSNRVPAVAARQRLTYIGA